VNEWQHNHASENVQRMRFSYTNTVHKLPRKGGNLTHATNPIAYQQKKSDQRENNWHLSRYFS